MNMNFHQQNSAWQYIGRQYISREYIAGQNRLDVNADYATSTCTADAWSAA